MVLHGTHTTHTHISVSILKYRVIDGFGVPTVIMVQLKTIISVS